MIKYEDVNKEYVDGVNGKIKTSVAPIIVENTNFLQIMTTDHRTKNGDFTLIVISESEIPNLIKQLENIKIYFENNKEEK